MTNLRLPALSLHMPVLLSVVVLTYRRPSALAGLLVELYRQVAALEGEAELIVVDNCPNQSAAATVDKAVPSARYVSETRAGIAYARNAGVHAARGRYLVFIDDDQRPVADWLASYRKMACLGHAAYFGPVKPKFTAAPPARLSSSAKQIFSRDMKVPTGTDITEQRAYLGTGNSMFDCERCFPKPDPFDPRFNRGGEDVWFLRQLDQDLGHRFFWCVEAAVTETVPAARVTTAYLRRRRFRNGQLRCLVEMGGRKWAVTAFWMTAGCAQALFYGLGVVAVLPFDQRLAGALSTRLAGGLGKVLWWWPERA